MTGCRQGVNWCNIVDTDSSSPQVKRRWSEKFQGSQKRQQHLRHKQTFLLLLLVLTKEATDGGSPPISIQYGLDFAPVSKCRDHNYFFYLQNMVGKLKENLHY